MKIEELISADNVAFGLRSPDKARLIQDLAAQAAERVGIGAGEIAQELFKREKLGSTGVGNGVALPHARLASITRPFGIIGRLKKPIEFDAIDGKPVDIAVLVLLPAGPESEQLNALACVARALREERRLDLLRQAKSGAELYVELVR